MIDLIDECGSDLTMCGYETTKLSKFDITSSKLFVSTKKQAKALGFDMGHYFIINAPKLDFFMNEHKKFLENEILLRLSFLFEQNKITRRSRVLVVGIGNPKIIADSFEGEIALDSFASTIEQDRAISKTIPEVQSFYEYNQGFDWETVIDNDTRVIKEHYKTIKCFFHHSLDTLKCDILMIGSKEDIFMPGDFYEKTYTKLIEKIGHGEKYIFSSGEHPAMISNAETFARLATKFLSE